VYGTPQPQGSTRAFMPKGAKYPIITSDNPKLKSWRQELAKAALLACCHNESLSFPIAKPAPMEAHATFYFTRPKSAKSPHKTTKPDADKLLRAVLDGMTGIVYEDDSQVAFAQVQKLYGVPERVEIFVCNME
jgi:crossover junction endodeoxyribonuclease RusA